MRFQVPQFIDIEDKIFGPLTFRQFVYLAGGAGLAFLFYTFLPTLLAIPFVLGAVALGLALAFYKYNDKPFLFLIQAWVGYIFSKKLYIWRKEQKKATPNTTTPENDGGVYVPRLSDSKLREIAWSLDVSDTNKENQ